MELAIPLIALGGMYVISNQSNNNTNNKKENAPKEKFTNMGNSNNFKNNSVLPNTNIPPQNYPIMNQKELVDTVQEYPNPNSATDKYFDQNVYENKQNLGKRVGNNIQSIYSLTGDYLESNEFKHNNMVPFNGGKVRGQIYDINTSETILDNMAGTGSQVTKKIEQAPLFKPQDNIQWAYGMPTMSDFYQSRVNPALKNNMVKPFESIHVGPGLDKGYGTEGSGGYNAGMEARNQWLPKTVDELRIATNPKEEYTLDSHEGPAQSNIKNLGILGKVEKYTPDTFFINSQDRWLTTTGAEKGNRLIPEEIIKTSHRTDTTTHYTGNATSTLQSASYVPKTYEESKRNQLGALNVTHSTASGRGPINDGESYIKSYTNYTNNRGVNNQPETIRSGFSRAIGAAIAPIMDVFKPSRKEEYVCNLRVYGNIGGEVPGNYVLNKGDLPNTTIKETTLYSQNGFLGNQVEGAYYVSEQQAIANQRDTTNCSEIGNAGGSASKYGNRQYDADYRQTVNENKEKTIAGRTNQGNAAIFNSKVNVTMSKLDSDRDNNRLWAPATVVPNGPSLQTYGKINMPQYYNECQTCERIDPALLNAFRENPYTHSLTNTV